MAATAAPGGSNTYIPSVESTKGLFVNFSRNPDDFAVNKYVQLVPVDKDVGRYMEMTVEEAGRILSTNDNEHLWADGEDEPGDRGNTEKHAFKTYNTYRRRYGYRLGQKGVEQASWDVLGVHGRIKAQQAMTSRTMQALNVLTTAGNWPSANTSAVSSISGVTGKWDVSTSARQDIKRSIDYALEQILLATLSAVDVEDMLLVMSPGCARKISVTQEIVDLIKQSPAAQAYIKGQMGPNAQFGLPDVLYGMKLVVEKTAKVTSLKGATRAASFALADTTPFIVSRPGSLNGSSGQEGAENEGRGTNEAPSFSTCTGFVYEDMTVESKHDTDNRVHKGRIVDDIGFVMTAGVSGFLFTAATD